MMHRVYSDVMVYTNTFSSFMSCVFLVETSSITVFLLVNVDLFLPCQKEKAR